MKQVFLSIIAVGTVAGAFGQSADPAPHTWGSAYLGGGAFFAGEQPLYQQDIAGLTHGSTLLAGDLSDHGFSNDTYQDGTGLFEAGVGLRPFHKEGQLGPELRIGVLYGGRTSMNGYYRRTLYTPYDTLVSSQTGEQFLVDSVHTSTYWIDFSTERFGLNASLVWRTAGRWSLFGGPGLGGGLLMNARTEVQHSISDGVEDPILGHANEYNGNGYLYHDGAQESFRNGTGWWLSLAIPVGVDFQIARHGDFWTRMHVCYELRPQLVFQGLPELGSSTGFGMASVFSVRFVI